MTIEYRQEKTDNDYGSCMWAVFHFDLDRYDLMITSDCGGYSYGWTPTPNSESFLHLMGRIDKYYLIEKIANRTVFNSKETLTAVMDYVLDLAEYNDVEIDDYDREKITDACKERTDRDCFDALKDALDTSQVCDLFDEFELAECICMTHPIGAKKVAEIFINHIQPIVRETPKALKDDYDEGYKEGYEAGKKDAVVHGYWEMISHSEVEPVADYACSVCSGILIDVIDDDRHELNAYCPMCGAKMDAERKEGDSHADNHD